MDVFYAIVLVGWRQVNATGGGLAVLVRHFHAPSFVAPSTTWGQTP